MIQALGHDEGQGDKGTNLADIILEKIALHEAAQVGEPKSQGGGHTEEASELPPKVVEVFSKYVGATGNVWEVMFVPR
jgi:essential nuclear protein 1